MKEAILAMAQPELVSQAAAQWDATGEARLLDDVTNLVYEIDCPPGRRILRLTHTSHHTEDEIIAELDWVNYLIQQGIPASSPLLSRNNRLTECYPVQDSCFVATAFDYAPGHFVDWDDPQEWNPALIQTFGRIMGRMHRVTKPYDPQHLNQKRPHWEDDDTLRKAAEYLPPDQRQVVEELETLLLKFRSITTTVDDFGLIHCDLNPTNFHVQDGKITLFDFDDCAYNWFINDIAITLPMFSDFYEHGDWEFKITQFFQWFMQGYEEENHLDEKWLDYLPASLELQNMITLVALHQANVPHSRYHSFYELVLQTYRQGHPLFHFDFRKAYRMQG